MVLKIGGRAGEDDALVCALAGEIREFLREDHRVLVVHGGGSTISELQERWGFKARFADGLRQTSPKEMDLVDMALAGGVNKRLVRLLQSQGIPAWGLSGADGSTAVAESIGGAPKINRTGNIVGISANPVEHLWRGGWLPVLAPPATDGDFRGINVNADEMALAMAAVLKTNHLVFLSDVPGILEEGVSVPTVGPAEGERMIADGVVTGGMIPKLRSALEAVAGGVGAVHIAEYGEPGDLGRILSGALGTKITEWGEEQ